MNLTPDDTARATELIHADRDAKLEYVRELIVQLRWLPEGQRWLANKWNMSPLEVQRLGMHAQSLILSTMTDPEELRASLISSSHYIVQDALRKRKPFLDKEGNVVMAPDPDHKAALAGIAQIAKLSGLDRASPPDLDEYKNKDLRELVQLAQKKLLPQGQPKLERPNERNTDSTEIITTGQESGSQPKNDPLPEPGSSAGGTHGAKRVRGGVTRSHRDPTGQGRGRDPEGE